MQKTLIIAALLSAAICLIHVFGGNPSIHYPIQESTLDPMLRAVSAVIWHAVTALLGFTALGLLWCANYPNKPLETSILMVHLSFIVLFGFYGLVYFSSLMVMPQWILFIPPAVIVAWGLRRKSNA